MTLTWVSLVSLVIVEETCYERRQTSKIKTTVLQRYAGSSLIVHCPMFFVHKSQIVTSLLQLVSKIKMLAMLLNFGHRKV